MPIPRLLLIDDEPELGALLQNCLDQEVCQLDYTCDPHDGLRLAMTRHPALILLDIDLPGINGLEVLTQLKHMPGTHAIPVVMLTARTDSAAVAEAMQKGAQDYLLKPFRITTLLERLNHLLGLQFPLISASAPQSARPQLPGQARALVIDDDPNICKIVAELIGDCGHHALVAHDAASGLQLARDSKPDLLLLDLQLPGANGFEVLESLRRENNRARLRVIILSGENDQASVRRAQSLGVEAYLLKPFPLSSLMHLLEQYLGN
ncbi:MAG: response regulator [Candidatus Sericytochromatia bacterium]